MAAKKAARPATAGTPLVIAAELEVELYKEKKENKSILSVLTYEDKEEALLTQVHSSSFPCRLLTRMRQKLQSQWRK